ncbi:acid phosphatase/Vanadium-dependent haloperoxidase [Trichoderma reesei RUT C-30]|uniref:Acid phosphatase/Vanadium-dependent haloperoxidase n=1 Tax=Hypocrea jecorina (strain ATCC 56765 / BCRC 32924 / NRRL 11460 / Rut C-30) TaxID=1344414 RepID=A0A024S9F4_HYPJR|nr:acid phosphatase/Vanadium-dependent haloperoxidase [Trichoderma reesei RUT C-30]
MRPYQKMARSGSDAKRGRPSIRLITSYIFDWVILLVVAAVGYVLGVITPNKRPFSLVDPNISFPFTEHETVPDWLLFVLSVGVPVVIIIIVSIIFVPGATVPKNTPASLIWRRKLWELHIGLLGLLMSVACGFFFISGIKNMCGKPRPDLLSRCQPDLENAAKYLIGGFRGEAQLGNSIGQLYSADICQQTDKAKLNDGFRSYPSGHSAASAGGLLYLSLFLASKFAVTMPFVATGTHSHNQEVHAAFPSRLGSAVEQYDDDATVPMTGKGANPTIAYNSSIQALRRQAAAPPVYLLVITVAPFCLAIFIAASRWFDFRHHGFDILFGFLIGIFTAIFSFRFYHLPITVGAGWAWGPRSPDRAYWAGVGRLGYVADNDVERATPLSRGDPYQDVELQNLQGGPSQGAQRST